MDKKKTCNCLEDCPCYPNCDLMMSSGQMMSDKQMAGVPKSARRAELRDPFEERMTPQPGGLMAEEENERDWQKFKEMYPDAVRALLVEVEDACDRMEYEGSMMFDAMPDKLRVSGMAKQICERVKERCPEQETADQNDMLRVLLCQEMFRRRCRHRGCRRC